MRGVGRRAFFGQSLAVVFLSLSRRLGSQASGPLRFRPLARPVLIPLSELSTPWRARPFVADAVTLPSAAKPNEPIRISGLIVRTRTGDAGPDGFSAVCVLCPHEHCDVDFMADPKGLPPEVVQEIGRPVTDAVYLCPCHNSTFSAEDGGRLGGPAPRGLYRFRITAVTSAAVEIGEVEEDLLVFA
jgi:Rieske Fe-S protein